ncbi:MAG: Asp-tRNA(Asn)/Glu-tRNA(Gln) amidotransferase subunit GatC [Kiloniellales bacterium]
MALDKETVRHIAWLARIKVGEAQLETMSHELTRIIDWVEQLNEVDTEGVAPMTAAVEMQARLRTDRVTDGGYAERIVENAPEPTHGFFAVPKVVE